MNIVPKLRYDGGVKVIPFNDPAHGIVFECEVAAPPSARGRTAYLYVTEEMVTDMLRELRSVAIAARSKPLENH